MNSAASLVRLMLCAALLLLAACGATTPASPPASGTADAAATAGSHNTIAEAGPALLSGRVWRVQDSTAVAPGTTYAFLDDGTLVIDSPHGTPLHGRWSYRDDALTLTEEGIDYPTDILELTRERLRLRSHNPGEPVELTLVPAPQPPLPPSSPPDAR